jgi:hypothetical protein
MKTTSNTIRLSFNEKSMPEFTLTLNCSRVDAIKYATELREILGKDKTLTVEIKQFRKIRSLDANSYAWVLISKIADIVRTSKEELYIEMLKKYGQREKQLLSVLADAVDMIFRATNNHCVEIGESELNSKTFKHLAILKGSSGYDSKEFSIFLDGIISECKELGIDTVTESEKNLLLKEWGK